MSESRNSIGRIAVVGGGITGLAAAHRLVELVPAIDVVLLEATQRLGGVLQTDRQDGFLLEHGADNWITNVPWANDLCRRIGFDDQIISTNAAHRRAFVVRRGRLHPIPDGFMMMAPARLWPIVTTPILSVRGKVRLACERWIPTRRDPRDESLARFVSRRLGRETYERLVQPLIGGIYAGDPDQLSAATTVARFVEMERTDGSLSRGMQRASRQARQGSGSGARYSMFVAPRLGFSSLVDAIAERLPPGSVRTGTPVRRIMRRAKGYTLTLAEEGSENGAAGQELLDVDGVIVAAPTHQVAKLLAEVDAPLARDFEQIPRASCAVVSLGYRRDQIAHPLDGFGVVVPQVERREIISCSFSSIKYQGRAPEGQVLLRVFAGGAYHPELADQPDNRLLAVATKEVRELLGADGPPMFQHVGRPLGMPQYYVGHEDFVQSVQTRTAALPGLELAGNAFTGVGVPHCIHSGELAAERIVCELFAGAAENSCTESDRAARMSG